MANEVAQPLPAITLVGEKPWCMAQTGITSHMFAPLAEAGGAHDAFALWRLPSRPCDPFYARRLREACEARVSDSVHTQGSGAAEGPLVMLARVAHLIAFGCCTQNFL